MHSAELEIASPRSPATACWLAPGPSAPGDGGCNENCTFGYARQAIRRRVSSLGADSRLAEAVKRSSWDIALVQLHGLGSSPACLGGFPSAASRWSFSRTEGG
jgi:hypothetical protein